MLLEGVQVYVGPFLKRSDRPGDKGANYTNVYVKNLAETVDEEKLRKLFTENGGITSIVIMRVRAFLLIEYSAVLLIFCLSGYCSAVSELYWDA